MAEKTATVTHDTIAAAGMSNGWGTLLQSTAVNHFVTYRVPVPQVGTYELRVRVRKANNRGIFQLAVASTLGGAYTNFGSPQDHYSATATNQELVIATVNATSVGQKFFRFRVTGKNAASSSFNLGVDYIRLIKQ